MRATGKAPSRCVCYSGCVWGIAKRVVISCSRGSGPPVLPVRGGDCLPQGRVVREARCQEVAQRLAHLTLVSRGAWGHVIPAQGGHGPCPHPSGPEWHRASCIRPRCRLGWGLVRSQAVPAALPWSSAHTASRRTCCFLCRPLLFLWFDFFDSRAPGWLYVAEGDFGLLIPFLHLPSPGTAGVRHHAGLCSLQAQTVAPSHVRKLGKIPSLLSPRLGEET